MFSVGAGRRTILQIGLDEGIVDDGVALFGIDIYEEVGGDADDLYLTQMAFPIVGFLLCGGVSLDAMRKEFVAAGFLGVVVYPGNEPPPLFYAFGVANFLSCRVVL